ncbi:COP23 domain-containing protein [Sodalinema gerasimenkoae]|uniref:COP23 domain-containing protein n=1 Tax=Sodalinema gerasimenkoae TaxID=2862348 RepID=UPI00135B0DA9|nr:COP23 domain-containing protein [Sodalinema gerasimenkoae]
MNWGWAMMGAIAAFFVCPRISQGATPEISRHFGRGRAMPQPEMQRLPILSETPLEFLCNQDDQQLLLLVQTPTEPLPLLSWSLMGGSELAMTDPCLQASEQLQEAYYDDGVDYITLGRVDGQFVVCLVGDRRSGCNRHNILLTIPPLAVTRQSTTEAMMSQLFDLNFPETGGGQCDIDESVYVDLRQYLDRDRNQSPTLSCRCYCGFCVCPQ